MSIQVDQKENKVWSGIRKISFRFFFVYFTLMLLPFNVGFWRLIFQLKWNDIHWVPCFYLVRYTPGFSSYANIFSFPDLLIVVVIAAVGVAVWTIRDKPARSYYTLNYWLGIVVRFRLFVAMLAYASIKIYPVLSPFPELSLMNTEFSEVTAWRIFTLSIGIAPGYQFFIAAVEMVAIILLLSRKTAAIGAFIIICDLSNVFVAQVLYGGGEAAYVLYLLSAAFFIFSQDAYRLLRIVILEKPAEPDRFRPAWPEKWAGLKPTAKLFAVGMIFIFLYLAFQASQSRIKYPSQPALAGSPGLYKVERFFINGQERPFAYEDSLRWVNVVFEKWATISVRDGRRIIVDTSNTEEYYYADINRRYELSGAGGRHYYAYETDTVQKKLVLRNKNKSHKDDSLILHYKQPDDKTIILWGINKQADSIHAQLKKIDKIYLLNESFEHAKQKTY